MNPLILNAKNVVFDIGKVLLDFQPQDYLPRLLPAPVAQKLMPPVIFGGDTWLRMDEGVHTAAEAAQIIAKLAGDPPLAPHVLHFMLHFPQEMSPLPAAQLLPALKSMGKKLYIISNYGIETFAKTEERFQALFSQFDGKIISAREKLIKPDLRIYQLLLNRYQLKAEECVFIDDLPENVQGAVAAGFKGIHYTGPEALE